MSQGILYIATADQLIDEAKLSAQTVLNEMDIPISLVAHEDTRSELFDKTIVLDDPEYGFADKIHGMKETPYDQTLFLDTDIYVDADISGLFDLLERFEIAAALNHDRISADLDSVPSTFPEYNTGVVVYDNQELENFFENWLSNHTQTSHIHPGDQASFRKTIFECNVRIATLPPEYNFMLRYPGHAREPVRIFHNRLLDIETIGADLEINTEDVIGEINLYDGHRVYYPAGSAFNNYDHAKTVTSNRKDSWYRRFRLTLGLPDVLSVARRKLNGDNNRAEK